MTFTASAPQVRARDVLRRRAHSRLVHMLRWLLPAAMFAIFCVLAGFMAVDAQRSAASRPQEVPTEIHMVNPHFMGRDDHDRSFDLSASRAMRDGRDMRRVLLTAPVMLMTVDGEGTRTLTADSGTYQEDSRILHLQGHVRLTDGKASTVATDAAVVDTRAGTVQGVSPLAGSGQTGEIQAQSYSVSDKGDRVILKGGVHARLNGGASAMQGGLVP